MWFPQQTQTPGASSSRIGLFLYHFIADGVAPSPTKTTIIPDLETNAHIGHQWFQSHSNAHPGDRCHCLRFRPHAVVSSMPLKTQYIHAPVQCTCVQGARIVHGKVCTCTSEVESTGYSRELTQEDEVLHIVESTIQMLRCHQCHLKPERNAATVSPMWRIELNGV